MLHIGELLGSASSKTLAAFHVWRDSTTKPVRWTTVPKKVASKIWHRARLWDRATRIKGKHGGIVGRSALSVLYALLWDCLNWRTGRLDPSIETIARRAGLGRTATIAALKRLKALRIIDWVRRAEKGHDEDGRFHIRQLTNAYGVAEPGQWPGYRDPSSPPPGRDTLGYPDRYPEPLEQAAMMLAAGEPASTYPLLMSDQQDRLAVALAQLGRAMGRI